MSRRLPDKIDLERAVSGALSFKGELPLEALPRLRAVLWEPSGAVRFELAFERDPQGRSTLSGSLAAVLRLQCQRCLAPFELPVLARVSLAAVSGPQEVDALPTRYDPLLLDEPLLRPRDLIEDELLLAIPLVPKHLRAQCGGVNGAGAALEALAQSPFAALADRRQKHSH